MTGIAIVGTGFVADYYVTTLANHPELKLVGAFDRDPAAIKRFSDFYKVKAYGSLDEVLADPAVTIVANLTSPESHYEVSVAALRAGKHVYCEKPLAMDVTHAQEVVKLADSLGLTMTAAPANALSPAHEAVAKALNTGEIGQPRLIYAEMEDGAVFRERWREWKSASGAPWPGQHEFEIGCTLEHAGYALSWLVSLFGPVKTLSAFSTVAFPEKGDPGHPIGPDYSVGNLVFESGPVARLTSGLSAPKDRSLTILGTDGTITVRDLWDHFSPVRIERGTNARRKVEKVANRLERKMGRALPFKPQPGVDLPVRQDSSVKLPSFPSKIDFGGGIAAQARAIRDGKRPFFSGDVALHITEVALVLSNAGHEFAPYRPKSGFSWPVAG